MKSEEVRSAASGTDSTSSVTLRVPRGEGVFGAACKNPDLWLTQVGGVFSVAGIVAEAFAEAGVEARLVSALGKVRHTAEVCHAEACKTLLALLGM